jgi:hypothetical protein
MSLQWHSPPQVCVAAWVRDVCGIVPAPSECQYFLDTNSCQIQEAARMLHATLEAELWKRGIMSTEQRGVAALIRNETGMFPSVASIDFYLENNGSIESAATSLLVEYANQELREYRESVQTHTIGSSWLICTTSVVPRRSAWVVSTSWRPSSL